MVPVDDLLTRLKVDTKALLDDVNRQSTKCASIQSTLQVVTAQTEQIIVTGTAKSLQNIAIATRKDHAESVRIAELTKQIAQQSLRDGLNMKILTLATLVFLPASFVSTFFGTDVVSLSHSAHTSPEIWWLFIGGTLSMTMLTLLIHAFWVYRKSKKSKEARNQKTV